ncbi:hypothetical protein V2G26_008656 [Clonostachys chloroleuca]
MRFSAEWEVKIIQPPGGINRSHQTWSERPPNCNLPRRHAWPDVAGTLLSVGGRFDDQGITTRGAASTTLWPPVYGTLLPS